MIGVADPDGSIRNPVVDTQSESTFLQDMVVVVGLPLLIVLAGGGVVYVLYTARDEGDQPDPTDGSAGVVEAELVMDAEMVEDIKAPTDEP